MNPTIAALEALDQIERLGSVQSAAKVLSLTPSAVSHRLRGLEAALGFTCVAPAGRGLKLTPRARAYLTATRPAMLALDKAATAARGLDGAAGPLHIAAAPGFSVSWLCPRLAEFRAAHPDIVVTLTSDSMKDSAEADVRIAFLVPGTAPESAVFLTKPEFFPVMAPALAQRRPIRTPSAIGDATLLHLSDRRDWTLWANACGAPDEMVDKAAVEGREIRFGDVNLLLSAAKAGLGISLGDKITCADALSAGTLVRPLGAAAPAERAYYLIESKGAASGAAPFKEWLLTTMKRDQL